MLKKLLFAFILFTGYAYLLVNCQSPLLKNPFYNYILDNYGRIVSSRAEIKVLYNPGLRRGVLPDEPGLTGPWSPTILSWEELLQEPVVVAPPMRIAVVTPDAQGTNRELLKGVLKQQAQVLVQCSRMDAWHTSVEGQAGLKLLHDRVLRVVIFDGGHHLPTLGMYPDIIIAPQANGYLAHSYMADGMQVEQLRQTLEQTSSPSILITVSRWALVKSPASLGIITSRVIEQLLALEQWQNNSRISSVAVPHISKMNGKVFCFAADNRWRRVEQKLAALGLNEVEKLYLAFDYRNISVGEAQAYRLHLQKKIDKPVETVNQPVTVFGAILRKVRDGSLLYWWSVPKMT